ncbi:SIR2 family protein [Xanthobacter sp. KR7-65]|uniref:SIR2 family protein n=1 Tax=Xanthobacter sp. KR7-65 TaxID=3156612 RepID=UPI0032B32A0C
MIPDELLTARDAGQVLFFCGAGVSQAEAHLPNFAALAGRVLSSLGSALDSPARRLFDASQDFENVTGITGVVATDRIFGLLEQEFYPEEVREAVATALMPPRDHGLGAHRVLLDLSRDASGVVRLITTNFDRLFEDCDHGISSSNPPHLPDPRRLKDFRGVIHIHGRVDADYQRACDDEFVLSSADFGRAYLADGWATRYIQALLQRFKIVFVGYSADDPPVQYLLEALSRSDEPRNDLYAFQAGSVDQAAAQWKHKGVQPIPYNSANRHAALWETLRAWAARARDVEAWHERVIAMAADGPAALLPHERGIVAHLAATRDGARRLAGKGNLLPAEWLGVFDPKMRYAPPGPIETHEDTSERVDPFNALGLDSDSPPLPTDPDNRFTRREVPNDALDLFASTDADRERLSSEATGRLRGSSAATASKLPTRLWHLGSYLVRVAHQPAAIWWAAQQDNLHPDIVGLLEWELRHKTDRFPAGIAKAWYMLIAAWREERPDPNRRRYELEAIVGQSGWSTETVRATIDMYRPLLVVEPSIGTWLAPGQEDVQTENILRLDVEYPRPHEPLVIPPEHLPYALALLRRHIEHAITLEGEIGRRNSVYFDTTWPEDGEQPDEDGFRMTGLLATFVNMMTRLAKADPVAAKAEFDRWPLNNNQVFSRLRIWAAGQPALLDPGQAAAVFLSLDEETFWTDQQERDLLHAIRDRWSEMSEADRERLEQRLLTGSFPWPESRDDLAILNAHCRLNRLQWLSNRGVEFGFDLEVEMTAIRQIAIDWEPRFANSTAQPHVGRVRSVSTDTDPTKIEGLPIDRVLASARDAAGRDFETFVNRRPFLGLAEKRPAFALAVLTDAARKGEFPEHEWAALLHATSKVAVKKRLLQAIAARLARLALEHVAKLRHPLSEWMSDRAEALIVQQPKTFQTVWDTLTSALAAHPPKGRFRRPDRSWVDDGLNQPSGRLVDALFKDTTKADLKGGQCLPQEWKQRLDQLLALPGDSRRHAIAMISFHLNWLYYIDPEWSESRLLAVADGEGPDAQAFWDGYFWAAGAPQFPLYKRLKPAFISLAESGANRRERANKLAGMLLLGWAGSDESAANDALIPDVELREVLIHAEDDLRTQMLWYLEEWSKDPSSKWGERIVPFLTNVWPRQRAIRTPRTSARLVNLALGVPDRFPEIVRLTLPLLGPIAGGSLHMGPFIDVEQGIANRHPLQLLDLLWKALPDDPWLWPYQTRRTLDALSARPEVCGDPRLAELLRREQNR